MFNVKFNKTFNRI